MAEGIPLKLAYLLRDPNTGSVVVPDLFHIGGTWTVRALLPGYPGSTTLGDFTIRLPSPRSEEFGRYKAQYDDSSGFLSAANRGIGLKVEAYQGDVAAGPPVMSGVVTKMNLPADGPWELSGVDTLYWLQQSQLLPGETFAAPMDGALPTGTLEIVQALTCTQEVVWDDDFTNWNGGGTGHTSADYTLSNWSFIAADPVNNRPALRSTSTAADAYAVTNTSWNQLAQWCYGIATAHGVMVAGSGSPEACEVAILMLADSTAANDVMVRATMQVASGVLFNIDVDIYTRSASVYTLQASQTGVFTNVRSPFKFELSAVFYENAGKYSVRLVFNGKDTGCLMEGASVPASGRLGLRFVANPSGAAVYVNELQFRARTQPLGAAWASSRFGAGTQTSDGLSIPQELPGNEQTHLDMLILAATLGGSLIRKNAGAGAKGDTLDYAASPGADRSAQIVLEEGVNVLAQGSSLSNVAEVYATDARVKALPVSDSGGAVTASRIGAAGDMVLTDTVSDVGTMGYGLLMAYSRLIQGRKGAPVVATQLNVIRTADLLRWNNGWGPRELDFVQAHYPLYGIRHQTAQIVGYMVTEGDATMTYYLTQLPAKVLPEAGLQRLVRSLDFVTTTFRTR